MRVQRGKIARELAELEEQMDRAFERVLASALRLPGGADAWRPALDVYETESAVVVRVELAGVPNEDVRVVVDGEYVRSAAGAAPGAPGRSTSPAVEIPGVRSSACCACARLMTPRRRARSRTATIELPRKQSGRD
jgi:hypothetical protein